jgi:hypothetical protein
MPMAVTPAQRLAAAPVLEECAAATVCSNGVAGPAQKRLTYLLIS